MGLEYRRRVCQAMNFIDQNLDSDMTLKEIGKAASFSEFHFHRIFKAVVGETPAEFIRRLRVERSARILTDGQEINITKIALSCGFSSSQNFARAFKTRFGQSPTEFKNSKNRHIQSNNGNDFQLSSPYRIEDLMKITPQPNKEIEVRTSIEQFEDITVAFIRKMGPYGKETCGAAFEELISWAAPKGLIGKETMYGVYWDNPEITSPEKCRSDACISIPEGFETAAPVGCQTIGGGSYLVCNFEMKGDDFHKAWEEAYQQLVDSNHEFDEKPCLERYHCNPEHHPEGKWVFDICLPVK